MNFFHNPFPSSIVGFKGYNVENISLENIEISYPGRASKEMAYVPLSRLVQVPKKIKNYPEFDMFRALPTYGFYIRHANGITFRNIKITLDNEDFRPVFAFDDVMVYISNKCNYRNQLKIKLFSIIQKMLNLMIKMLLAKKALKTLKQTIKP